MSLETVIVSLAAGRGPEPHSAYSSRWCTTSRNLGSKGCVKPQDRQLTPKGSVHRFSNPFDAPVRALIVQSPDIGPQYFKDIGAVVNIGSPPDKAALIAVMSRYGQNPGYTAYMAQATTQSTKRVC